MLRAVKPLACGLHSNQSHGIIEEIGEQSNGIGAAADAGDRGVGQPPDLIDHLRPGLSADDALELADHQREWVRPGRGAEEIVRGLELAAQSRNAR